MVSEQIDTRLKSLLNIRQTFVLGLKVLGGELLWNLVHVLRGFEIKQMDKRLAKEYETLGRLHAGKPATDEETLESQQELCLKQIAFLEQEIAFLQEELLKERKRILEQRKEKWAV